MIEQQIPLLDRALQGKLIPITHASQRETLRSESIRKEIPTYTDSIYRPPSKPPNIQNTNGERVWVLKNESLLYTESDYRPPPKSPDVPKLSRILLDLEMDLNKDHPHGEIQLALEIRPENTISIHSEK